MAKPSVRRAGPFCLHVATVLRLSLIVLMARLGTSKLEPKEKAVLLAIKAGFDPAVASQRLSSWDPDTDPCEDNWDFVYCNCTVISQQPCGHECPEREDGEAEHVFGILLGRQLESSQPPLGGLLADDVEDLKELRALTLSNENLKAEFDPLLLPNLESIIIRGNQFRGSLSPDVIKLKHLRYLMASNNTYNGTIPDSWCNPGFSSSVTVNLLNNPLLCGVPSSCLYQESEGRLLDTMFIQGNALFYIDNLDPESCCNVVPPTCKLKDNCGIIAPEYITDPSVLAFNFTNFTNPSGAALDYQPFLCSQALVSLQPPQEAGIQPDNIMLLPGGLACVAPGNYTTEMTTFRQVVNFTGKPEEKDMVAARFQIPSDAALQASTEAGSTYVLALRATAGRCKSRSTSTTTADYKAPLVSKVKLAFNPPTADVYNTEDFQDISTQKERDEFGMSWDLIQDGVDCCTSLKTQVWEVDGSRRLIANASSLQEWSDDITHVKIQAEMRDGGQYVGILYMTNVAGKLGEKATAFVTIQSSSSSNVGFIIVTAVAVLLVLATFVAAAYAVWAAKRERKRSRAEARKRHQYGQLRNLMYTMASKPASLPMGKGDAFDAAEELAFVITDLENSTACANANRRAYKDVQVTHDQVMRELIAKYNGFEVATEGDSFQVAFLAVGDAISWAMDVQMRLLETEWPMAVIKLPSCNVELGPDGRTLFHGPRVRMGIHWATQGTFTCMEHPVNKTRFFRGPGWEMAHEVGDEGWGGQVILTHSAWEALHNDEGQQLKAAGFPLVGQLGMYNLASWPMPMWLYEVRELMGRPLSRTFPPFKKLRSLLPGRGLAIMYPPTEAAVTRQALIGDVNPLQALASGPLANGGGRNDASIAGSDLFIAESKDWPGMEEEEEGDGGGAVEGGQPRTVGSLVEKSRPSRWRQVLDALRNSMKRMDSIDRIGHSTPDDSEQLVFVIVRMERHHTGGDTPPNLGLDGGIDNVGSISIKGENADGGGALGSGNSGGLHEQRKGKSWLRRRGKKGSTKAERTAISQAQPGDFHRQIYTVVMHNAQQFSGYLFSRSPDGEALAVAFTNALDALRFCHGAQIQMMYSEWRPDRPAVWGPTQATVDGRLIFYGPRLAMVLHQSHNFMAKRASLPVTLEGETYWPPDVFYTGQGIQEAIAVCQAIHGGQVVLTEGAWRAVQERLPTHLQVTDLGVHKVADGMQPTALMEVMPQMLANRTFERPRTTRQLAKGFGDSPDPTKDMAICFAKVCKPHEVKDALAVNVEYTDDAIVDILTSYFGGVMLLESVVRDYLAAFDGYECKEPEPGKFTLAFQDLEMAIRFCCAVQLHLLDMPWPERLLQWQECSPLEDQQGRLIRRGLAIQMGVTWGRPDSRKQLSSGRADYFGSLANMAARIMGTAQPGQTLVHGTPSLHQLGQTAGPECALGRALGGGNDNGSRQGGISMPPVTRYLGSDPSADTCIVLLPVGKFELKGFPGLQELYGAVPRLLEGRYGGAAGGSNHGGTPSGAAGSGGGDSALNAAVGSPNGQETESSRRKGGSESKNPLHALLARNMRLSGGNGGSSSSYQGGDGVKDFTGSGSSTPAGSGTAHGGTALAGVAGTAAGNGEPSDVPAGSSNRSAARTAAATEPVPIPGAATASGGTRVSAFAAPAVQAAGSDSPITSVSSATPSPMPPMALAGDRTEASGGDPPSPQSPAIVPKSSGAMSGSMGSMADAASSMSVSGMEVKRYEALGEDQVAAARQVAELFVQGRAVSTFGGGSGTSRPGGFSRGTSRNNRPQAFTKMASMGERVSGSASPAPGGIPNSSSDPGGVD